MKQDPMRSNMFMQSQAAHVVQETQKDAEKAVQQAQSQAASVEDRSNQVIWDIHH